MILKEIVDLMDIGCKEADITFEGIKICELGNQKMKWTPEGTGKKYLLNRGAKEHISIDMNGKDGALRIDLSKPVDKWQLYFDMVTNYGTAEHVEGGIYQAYKNIHNFTRPGGVIVNAGPLARCNPWHSPYHYEVWFFKYLADRNNYKHIISEVRIVSGRNAKQRPMDRSLLVSVFIKNEDSPLISEKDFNDINGIEGL